MEAKDAITFATKLFNSVQVKVFYSFFIWLFRMGIGIAALWNSKAKRWITGRTNLFTELEKQFAKGEQTIWMHCASAGEFEQGKPVIEKLTNCFPNYTVVVSFFSPSGFEAGKKYKGADHIIYLPLDTARHARRFVEIVNPALVIFIKYDYWFYHLKAVAEKKIPLILVSAIFRKQSIFFKPYGSFHRSMLYFFTQIFVQDQHSKNLLQTIQINHSTVAGDTRFDRVSAIASKAGGLPEIEKFIGNNKILIAGSTWPDDEKLLQSAIKKFTKLKVIIAPHEVNDMQIKQLHFLFPHAVLHSELYKKADSNILIIDNMGMLSALYQYATITYIGGGFTKSGIHNTLEAAVWQKPVLFGPNYQKFKEAKELIQQGAAFSISSGEALTALLENFFMNEDALTKASTAAANYVKSNTGATQKIIQYIQENRLLTTP